MVNQLLAGVHIAVAAEAMALAARARLSPRLVYAIITSAAGNSWMYENRVPHMLAGDFTPLSALDIFVKDLGIVLAEAQGLRFPLPLAAAAHQQFLLGTSPLPSLPSPSLPCPSHPPLFLIAWHTSVRLCIR
eukprot:jgi/Mesen1/6938/ME000036S06266